MLSFQEWEPSLKFAPSSTLFWLLVFLYPCGLSLLLMSDLSMAQIFCYFLLEILLITHLIYQYAFLKKANSIVELRFHQNRWRCQFGNGKEIVVNLKNGFLYSRLVILEFSEDNSSYLSRRYNLLILDDQLSMGEFKMLKLFLRFGKGRGDNLAPLVNGKG